MIATQSHARDLTDRLNDCRRQQDDLWARFAQDFDKKSELVIYLIDLGFSLSEDQVAQMEENHGIPVAHLTAGQQALLSQAEPLAREIQFLAHIKDQTLAESTLQYDALGHLQFTWTPPGRRYGWGINWLPYSQGDRQRNPSFAPAQKRWQARRDWLVRQHYADFRQAADCGRLIFLLALSLSPEQIEIVAETPGAPVSALRPDQRVLLEAAMRLYPTPVPNRVSEGSIQFEPRGQFWLQLPEGAETSNYGTGWLPYSWERVG